LIEEEKKQKKIINQHITVRINRVFFPIRTIDDTRTYRLLIVQVSAMLSK